MAEQIGAVTFKIIFINANKEMVLNLFYENDNNTKKMILYELKDEPGDKKYSMEIKQIETVAVNKIIEMSVPFGDIIASEEEIAFVIVVEKDGLEMERWPNRSIVNFIKPQQDYFIAHWSA